MNQVATSLRLRLLLLILVPLTMMAVLLGYWRFSVANQTAETLFDRSLLATALAISRDVAISDGDVLSPATHDLMRDIAGGEVFYHVTGPGGIYVTGYAYPPRQDNVDPAMLSKPVFFEARYRGQLVRVVKITERLTIGGLTGDAPVTVWQNIADRNTFARQLAMRAVVLMGALLGALTLLVWFGVQMGLRPLNNLQAAIAARSPEDLSKIKRPVPPEVQGIVATLNRLFGQLQFSINAQQEFISDAAHQLRNPAAAVLSMAEAARDAKTEEDRHYRAQQVVDAARSASRVADQLLSLDRLRRVEGSDRVERFDLGALAQEVSAGAAAVIIGAGLDFGFSGPPQPLMVLADKTLVAEAIKNLIDNAATHGGDGLTRIEVNCARKGQHTAVTVVDDGVGLAPADQDKAFRRFGQLGPAKGSGLGLAIAYSVAERHNGTLDIDNVTKGTSITLTLPVAP